MLFHAARYLHKGIYSLYFDVTKLKRFTVKYSLVSKKNKATKSEIFDLFFFPTVA